MSTGEAPGSAALTVAQALALARQQGLDRVDSHRLLGHVLGRERAWLIAHDDDRLQPRQAQDFQALYQRRLQGEPVAYLVGEQAFHGLQLQVTPDVLVPRPDTETLVDWALALLAGLKAPAPHAGKAVGMGTAVDVGNGSLPVLDLGTGSGAIALAIAHRCPAADVTATDLSPAALAVAQANAQRLQLDKGVHFAQGAWWQAVPSTATFALVVSNPPYIAGDDPHLPALRHEPRLALTPEGDGLDAFRAIVADAPRHLRPGGWLLFEHGFDQAHAVAALLRDAGFGGVQTRVDLAGLPRCTAGQWPGPEQPAAPCALVHG